jgi:hypothetical protein
VIAYIWIDPTTGERTSFDPQDIVIVRELSAVPEPARVELDAVRERLAEVRGSAPAYALVEVRKQLAIAVQICVEAQRERDDARAEVQRLRGYEPLTAALTRSLDVERAEVTLLLAELAARTRERDKARAEVERVRGLVARYARWVEVCEGTDFLDREPYEGDHMLTAEDLAELLRIRREAGLT